MYFLYCTALQAQFHFTERYVNIEFEAFSTGLSTGKIGTLSVNNRTKDTIRLVLPPLYIPANGEYQPYIIPHLNEFMLAPHTRSELELRGYCAFPFREPTPQNKNLTNPVSWIEIDTSLSGYKENTINSSAWFSDPTSRIINTTTGKSLDQSINTLENDYETAHILHKIWELLDRSYNILSNEKKIKTPYSPSPSREYDTIIQYCIWICIAELNGLNYSKSDFKEVIYEEVNRISGEKSLKEKESEELNEGISEFWIAFMSVLYYSGTFDISKINRKYYPDLDEEIKKVLNFSDKSN